MLLFCRISSVITLFNVQYADDALMLQFRDVIPCSALLPFSDFERISLNFFGINQSDSSSVSSYVQAVSLSQHPNNNNMHYEW